MNDSDSRYVELGWLNVASRARISLERELRSAGFQFELTFLGQRETSEKAQTFWAKVRQLSEIAVESFSDCMHLLSATEKWQSPVMLPVLWFHAKTDSTGAIRIRLNHLVAEAIRLRDSCGPDFLFMSEDGEFGFCFEQQDNECSLKHWGIDRTAAPK